MKSFIEEYGLAILAAISVAILITFATPVGDTIKNVIDEIIDRSAENSNTSKCYAYFYAGDGLFANGEAVYTLEFENEEIIEVLPESPVREGFIFGGWYTSNSNSGGDKLAAGMQINNHQKFYARWLSDPNYRYDSFSGTGMKGEHLFVGNIDMGEFKAGTLFNWYDYDWQVLSVNGNDAFVISSLVLGEDLNNEAYNNSVTFSNYAHTYTYYDIKLNQDVVVYNCYSGTYIDSLLNDTFYRNILSSDRAVKATNIKFGIHGDETLYSFLKEENVRYVYLPNYEEIKTLLRTDKARVAYTNQSSMNWWTRTGDSVWSETGGTKTLSSDRAFFVSDNGQLISASISDSAGIRPVMHLDLSKIRNIEILGG